MRVAAAAARRRGRRRPRDRAPPGARGRTGDQRSWRRSRLQRRRDGARLGRPRGRRARGLRVPDHDLGRALGALRGAGRERARRRARDDADGDRALLRLRAPAGRTALDRRHDAGARDADDVQAGAGLGARGARRARGADPRLDRRPAAAALGARRRLAAERALERGRRRRGRRGGVARLALPFAGVPRRRLGDRARAHVRVVARLLELLQQHRGEPPAQLLARVARALVRAGDDVAAGAPAAGARLPRDRVGLRAVAAGAGAGLVGPCGSHGRLVSGVRLPRRRLRHGA